MRRVPDDSAMEQSDSLACHGHAACYLIVVLTLWPLSRPGMLKNHGRVRSATT